MEQIERTFCGRAYSMDIRLDKHEDDTLSVYKAFPYPGLYLFAMRGDRETIIRRFDVSGSIQIWLERKLYTALAGGQISHPLSESKTKY